MPSTKAQKFFKLIDRGWGRAQALKRAGFHPSNAHSSASLAHQLLARRYGETPRGYSKLTPELQAIWQALSEADKELMANLPTGEPWNTLEKNLEEYTPEAAERRRLERANQPALPLPSPPPAPAEQTLEELGAEAYRAYIQAKTDIVAEREELNRKFETDTNAGLPWDFIVGLQQTAHVDAPVTEGIWTVHGFQSREDLAELAFKIKHADLEDGW